MGNANYKGFRETTTNIPNVKTLKPDVLFLSGYFLQVGKYMREYFPGITWERGKIYFACLTVISTRQAITYSTLSRELTICDKTAKRACYGLLERGLIEEVRKPRLIIPLQAYKMDRGWSVTTAGLALLNGFTDRLREGIK